MSSSLSRNGTTSLIGKLTHPLGPYKVPEETADILEQEARKAGLNLNEFLRDLAMIRAHGEDFMVNLHRQRIAVVLGKAEEK